MCTGVEIAAAAGVVGGLWKSSNDAKHARRDAEGAVADAAKERERAKAQATTDANAQIAMRRKAMRENSLLTGGGNLGPTQSGARTTLGVG